MDLIIHWKTLCGGIEMASNSKTAAERIAEKAELGSKVADLYGNYKAPAGEDPGTTQPEFKDPKHMPTKGIKAKVIKAKG